MLSDGSAARRARGGDAYCRDIRIAAHYPEQDIPAVSDGQGSCQSSRGSRYEKSPHRLPSATVLPPQHQPDACGRAGIGGRRCDCRRPPPGRADRRFIGRACRARLVCVLQVDRHDEPVFAQRYHPHDGRDRKIYAIGGQLFGVKKVFPRRTEEDDYGEPFTLTPELRDIAVRCGQAFGIDLYGVDIIESEGKPYVVDMCSIPGFKGVPDAVPLLTRYFYEAAERGASGEPPSQIAATADSGH